MSLEPKSKSHATAWIVSVLAGLLLYVGSYMVVIVLAAHGTLPDPLPEWVFDFYSPVYWLHHNTPLDKPLDAYLDWWIKVLAKP